MKLTDLLKEEEQQEDEMSKAEDILMSKTSRFIPVDVDHNIVTYKIHDIKKENGTINANFGIYQDDVPEKLIDKFIIAKLFKSGLKLVHGILLEGNVDLEKVKDNITLSIEQFFLESNYVTLSSHYMSDAHKTMLNEPHKITDRFLNDTVRMLESHMISPETKEYLKQECERVMNILQAYDEGVVTDESGNKHTYKIPDKNKPYFNMYHKPRGENNQPITLVLSRNQLNTTASEKDLKYHITDLLHTYNMDDVYVLVY